jgi:hypothetical protein
MSGIVQNPILSLEVQDSISPGAKAAADALQKVGDTAVTTETALGKVSATASSLVNRFDPATKSANQLAAAQQKLSDATVTLARSVAAGDVTQAQAAGTLATLQTRVRSLQDAHESGLTPALQHTSLTLGQILPQFIQFGSSLQGGINPMVAFTQQGHQLADQMLATGTSIGQLAATVTGGLKSALGAILSPIGLAVTGAALLGAGIYAVTSAALNAQARIGDLQQGLSAYGQSAGTVIAVSNDLAKSTGLSRAALDDLGKSLSTGIQNFQATGAQLKNLELLTRDFGAATGQSLSQAAAGIQAAFGDPAREAIKLMQDGIHGFTGELVANVTALQNQGQTGAAANLVLTTLGKSTKDAAQPTTDLGKAMRDLGSAFNTAGAGGTTFAEKLGTPFVSAMTVAVEQIAKMASALNGVEGGAIKAANAVLSLANPTPGSTIGAVAGAYLTSLGGGGQERATNDAASAQNAEAGINSAGQYTPAQIQAALIQAGIPANAATTLTAIAGAESNYGANPVSGLNTNGTRDYGVFQVNSGAWPQLNPASLPGASLATQAAAAAQVYQKQGLTAWSTYNSGKYQQFMPGVGTPGNPLQLPPVNVSGALPTAGPSAADKGLLDSSQASVFANDYAKATTTVNDLVAAETQLQAANQASGPVWDALEQRLQAAKQQLENTLPALTALTQPIDLNTAALKAEATAWSGGASAVTQATIQQQAYTDARKIAATTDANFSSIQADIATHLNAQAQAEAAVAAAQETSKNNDQAAYLQAEVSTLGQDYDTRQKILAALQEKQALEQSGKQYTDEQKQALIDQKVALAGVTDQLQLMQSSLQEVGNFGVQVFDQVGSAITNAFVSGQGAAVNFGSILKSVAGIALQELGKLAIGNVLSNAVGGTNLPTLGSVFSALAGSSSTSGGTATSSSGGLSNLSNLFQLGSAGNTLAGSPISFSGVSNYLGLGNVSGYASNLLATPIFGSVSGAATDTALSGLGAGVYGPETAAAYGAAGGAVPTTLGGIIGGVGAVGAGFGVGSLAGSYLQGALKKTGPAPLIGAGIGAGAGLLVGGPIGALAGGLLGGVGGALIGPHVATPYTNIPISAANGQLQLGTPLSQGEDATAEVQAAQAIADAINNLRGAGGINLVSTGGINRIGDPVQAAAPGKAEDIPSAFSGFRFNVADTSTQEGQALAGQVNGQSFGSIDQLQAVFTEVDTFVKQTLPALTTQQTNIGSFATSINGLYAAFQPAIDEGTKLGIGVDALTAAWNKQTDAVETAIAVQVQNDQTGFQASYLNAAAQVSGSPQDAQTAALYSFDNGTATQARQQLVAEYTGIFGDAYATSQQYVDSSAALEKSLGEQRLAIQTTYNNQITQAASQQADAAAQAAGASITSLLSYVQKLQGSSDSPLSATDQYSLARNQFNAVSGAAQAGDATSIGNLPTYADAFLSASRAVNGSGLGYANDFNSVTSSVSSIASLGAAALTQSFMQAAMQSQTAAIVTAIQSLQTQVAGLQTALSQASLQPARIAA